MSGDDQIKTSLSGTVVKTQLGGSSKSAHTGFVLKTKKGKIKLRRDGGSPFYDDYFEKYEDQLVSVEGYDMDSYFLVLKIERAS